MPNWNDPESIRKWLDEKNKQKLTADPYRNSSNWYGAPASVQPRPQLQPLPTPTPIIQQPGLPTVQMQGAPRPQNSTNISNSNPNSPTVALRPQPLQQRPSSYLPQTQTGAFSYNPVPRGSITDGTWKPADAWNWMTEGINNTPAMKYTQGRVEDRKADGDQWYDAILNGVDYAFDTPGRILKTQPLIPNMAQVFQNGTKKGEDWFSVADVSSALGSFYNKAYDLAVKNGPNFFNPLNPEGLNATFLDPKNNLMSHVAEEVQRSVDFKKSILALPPQQRAVAEMVIANNYTGLNAMQDSYKAFEEKATMPAVWRQQAQELAAKAQAGGLPDQVATNMMRQASVLWNRAQEIEAKSYSQIIDEHQNFRSELVMGVLFDPTDFIVIGAVQAIGMTHEAITAANMARKMNISPEAAIKAMEAAVADASPLVSRVLGGGNVFDTKSAWSKINPFARTSETLARMDTNELFKAAVPLFAGIHGGARVDAVKVLSDWLGTAGQKIVQGMPIGSMQNLADNAGNVRFGPGLLGNEDVIKRFPILKIVEKQLMEMGSLKGDGVFRVDEFLSEFRRITQQGADLYYGVATNTLKKAVPAVGKKAAKEAITYKTGMTTADKIAIPSNLMRAIMSDMWLNSRPAHWIRNAASASTQLLAKGLYTWRSIEDIANNYARRLGIPGDEALNLMPTLRTTDAMGGVPSIAENTENFTRKFWPNNNPYAGLMEWGAQRWGGTQQLLKNIPVAEQSLYLTGLDRGMERAFRQYWSMAISQQIAPLFESMGVAPDLTKKFIGEIIDAGNGGAGKKEIIDSFRQTVEKSTITTTLTDLGVPEELITDAKVRQELAQVFRALTPMNLADSEATIRGLFARLRLHPGAVLNDAAPMPEDILGSKDTIVADVASYIDDMERTAKAGGIDPQSTKAFMQVMAKDMTTVQSEGMKNMLADFARATDPTAAGSVMVETFSALVERQQVLRQMMDAASQRAIKASMGATPEVRKAAWAAKWVENQQLIKTYLEDIKGLFASGRTSLMSGAPTNPAFNRKAWDDLIDRYVNYDPAAIEATRGIVGQGPTDNITKRVIDANRAYLDEAMTTLLLTSQWIAKQGNPASTEDALNHIQDAWAAINHIGAQTAAVVAIKRDTMLPLQAADFYTQSADEWKRAFERMVTYVHAYRRDALFTHLSHSAPNRLMWKGADGAVYRLEGMMTDGRYLVKNTQTNAETVMNASGPQPAVDPDIMKFAGDPAKFKASDEVVPSYIVDSYNKVLNNTEEQIDEIIAQVDGVPVTTVTEESLQATAKQGGTAKKNAQWAGVESITPPTFKVQEVEPPPAAPFKFPGEEGYTGPASVPTPPVAPKVDMNGVALTTPIQRTELRKAASASGIATAAKSGNPTDKHLLGSIKKRLGWSYTSLDNIPQNRLPAIYEMLTKRTEETAGAAAKLGVPTPPTNVAGDVPLPTSAGVTSFTTAKGSTYTVHPDGTTTRMKSVHLEHPGDEGLKERSLRTVYVTKEQASALATPASGEWRYAYDPAKNTMSMVTWNAKENRWGVSPSSRNIPVSKEPATGLMPLEVWKLEENAAYPTNELYKRVHFGNPIVETTGSTPLPSVTEVTAPAAKVTTVTEVTAPAAKVTTIPDWARVVRLDDPNATDEQKIKRLFEMATKNEPFGMPDVEDAAWMSLGKSGAIKTLEDAKRYYYQWKALPVEKQSGKGLLEWSRTAKDAAPAAKVENIVPTAAGKGKVVKAWTDPTNKYDLQYEVVEYDTLIASHTRNFTENPAFPGELQPRDRSSAISQVDLTKKAASFDPDELLSFGNNLDRGAPILRAADNVVVSGNGRALVVGMISPEKYAEYQRLLLKNANEYGIDPAFIQGMKRPVLVRRQVSDANLANLATEANSRVSQGMNKVEVAGDIAKRLDGNILLAFNQGKYPTLLDALKSGTNQDFLRKFISLVYPTERPTYLDAAGNISQDGVDLIRSSLFHVLFGGKADDLLDNYVMQVASELKVLGNGIEMALGPLAKLEKNLPDLALGADLADAMTLLRDARSNKLNVQQMISQGNMFSSFTPEAELLALLMESNMRSATKIGQALRSYALSAMEAGQGAGQSTLLDVGSPVKIDLLRNAMSGKGAPSLFDEAGFLPPGFMPASNVAKWGQTEELKFLINKNELNINDAYLKLRKSIAQNKAGVKEASMGHYAAQTLKTLDQMEQRILKALPEMAAGTVNNLTPAQRLALFDAVAGKVAPAYDNVLAAASNAGERLANAAMLNFQDRRGTDWILALLFPYHYFWSRTAKNWAAQVLEKPAFLDVWYTTERQIENENRAKDLPTRLQGTLPNPLKEMTGAEWMPDRIGNPFRWMLPFSMYMANEFIDPEDAQSEGEKWMMRMQQYTPGMFPHIRFAIDTFLDNTSPLPDGRKRVGEFELGGNVPLWRIAGYTSQAMGGMTANQLNAGDKFDPYRVARWASNNSVPVDGKKPKFTPEVAQYVQQMAINQRDGVPLEQGIPKNFVTAVTAAYKEGLQATAWERLASTAGSFFTGNAGYYYSPEEAKMRATSEEYNQAGFSPTNPVGSQTAKNTIIDQEPYISTGWTKSMAIPGETGTMPAQSANTGMLYDTRSNLYAEKKAAEDAAIRAALNANPALKVSEMNKIRAAAGAPFQEQIDALKKEIDGASAGTVPPSLMDVGPDTVPTGTPVQMMTPQNAPRELKDAMNPQEQQSVAIGNAFDNAKALPGRPADGAPDAEWNNYKAMQQAYVVEQLSDTKMTEAEILKLFDESSNWNRGPAELEVRQNAEERVGATRGAVVSQFGEEAGSVWDAYYALPKGDARSQFAAENPQIKVYNFAAYNPNEYAQASEMFGKDAIMAWAATPPWGESAEAAAKREAYFDANPVVWFVDAWVDGRPREYDPESKPETRNFGADWKEAETLYGEDIWGKVIQWRGADKAGRREIRSADPALDQFIDWWYGLMPQTTTRGGFVSGGSRGGWGGGGGGGRGGGYNPYAGQRPPTIYAESMNKDLWYGPRGDTWRPDRYDDSWRYAGQDIRPEPIKKWKKGA